MYLAAPPGDTVGDTLLNQIGWINGNLLRKNVIDPNIVLLYF
jgi:hypothetical protein